MQFMILAFNVTPVASTASVIVFFIALLVLRTVYFIG